MAYFGVVLVATIHEDKDRKIIPRWRGFSTTVRMGELQPLKTKVVDHSGPAPTLELRRDEWRKYQTIAHAGDFISVGVSLNKTAEVIDAAEFILDHGENVPKALKSLSLDIVGRTELLEEDANIEIRGDFEGEARKSIHETRKFLHDESRNAFLWVNLAHLYSMLGFNDQATRAIEVALSLQPENRFVLRSAARHFIHTDDYRRAHEILLRSERTKYDPWLLAAEIAIAEVCRRPSKFVKRAKRIIDERYFEAFQLSELASAISTLEFESGNSKKGKKHIEVSLERPTENTIAQVAWTMRNFSLKAKGLKRFIESSHEANAWECCRNSNWKKTVSESWLWLEDQPFSSRPSTFGSYIAATGLGDYEESAEIALRGLVANPKDFTLINNSVFALAQCDKIEGAIGKLPLVNENLLNKNEYISWQATKGLVEYRRGNPQIGEQLYIKAINEAKNKNNDKQEALASLWFALEELRIKSPKSNRYKKEAIEKSKKLPYPDMIPLRKRVESFSVDK